MKKIRWMCMVLVAALPCGGAPVRSVVGGAPVAATALALDEETVVGPRHYLDGYPAEGGEGEVNAVVEIPCGTTGKFEVDEADGWLKWQRDRDHGGRRAIDYLAFPVNYGMVPRTLAADGDALDIVVLGAGIERGYVARTRVIGVLEMGEPEGGERDDKLIAVPAEDGLANGFSRLRDLPELDEHYPAVRDILERWFANYWGAGNTHVLGWGDAADAAAILDEAERAYEAGAAGTPVTTSLAARTARLAAAGLRPRAQPPSAAPVR